MYSLFYFLFISSCFLLLFIWFLGMLAVSAKLYKNAFNETFALKQKRGWLSGSTFTITIDTKVSMLKNKMPVSFLWMLPSLFINLLAVILCYLIRDENPALFFSSFLCLFTFVFCFFMLLALRHTKTVAYSKDIEINLALNHSFRCESSKCWTVISIIQGAFYILGFLLRNMIENPIINFSFIICAFSILDFFIIVYYYEKIKKNNHH